MKEKYTKWTRKEPKDRAKEYMIITVKIIVKWIELTARPRTSSINKEIKKSGDKLLAAQYLSDLDSKTNKTQIVRRDICSKSNKNVKTGLSCGHCQKMVSLQMWKHLRRTSFKWIGSRTTMHMCARPTSELWKYFADSVSEEYRWNKKTKRKIWKCKRETNVDSKDS